MTGSKKLRTLGNMLGVLIRIYTPFVCTLCVLIHGIYELLGCDLSNSKLYTLSSMGGYSYAVILYIISTSKRMCKWYKRNTYMLLLVIVEGSIYNYMYLSYSVYLQMTIITSFVGLILFIIYLITNGVISHNRKRSQKTV